jgi:hypothetical protein
LLVEIPLFSRPLPRERRAAHQTKPDFFRHGAVSEPGGQLINSNEETEESEDLIEPPILPQAPFYKK